MTMKKKRIESFKNSSIQNDDPFHSKTVEKFRTICKVNLSKKLHRSTAHGRDKTKTHKIENSDFIYSKYLLVKRI